MTISLLELLNAAHGEYQESRLKWTRKRLSDVLHDPDSSAEEVAEALKVLNDTEGYENLPDE